MEHTQTPPSLCFFLQEKIVASVSTDSKQREVGYWGKQVFELSNHLGNVLATITDKKLQVSTNNSSTSYFEAEVQSVQDYYAFGMQMPGRKSSGGYRYGFNGKENDNEVKGEGNSQDYGWRIHDPRIGRFLSVDPLAEKNNFESPYVFVHNNPLIYVDPDGRDGIIVIKGGQININANIYAYGAGATKAVVAQMQKDINSRWGGNFSAQTSDGKQKFNVNVNVSIGLYEGKEKNDPFIIEESWNPSNRDNFIEIGAGDKRSYVSGGDEGEWRSQGRNGLTLAQDDPAPHEVGHLLGLDDRYTDKNGPNKGWETNIMGSSQNGKVEQRNIDGILGDAMKAYEVWSKDKNNAGKEFRYEINTNNPNKENK